MNKRALVYGFVYSVAVIIFKLVILLGGFTLSKFGFYYSTLVASVLIIPFFFMVIYQAREKDSNGLIGGREAFRLALTVLAIATIIISIYNYIEFNWKFKDIAIQYYNSDEYLNILKAQQAKAGGKIKEGDFPNIINEQITGLSAFKATTGKLIPMLFFGVSGAFVSAMFLKKSVKQ